MIETTFSLSLFLFYYFIIWMFPGVFGYLEWISHTDGSRPCVSIVSRYQQVLHIWLISRAWIASRSTNPTGFSGFSLSLSQFNLFLSPLDDWWQKRTRQVALVLPTQGEREKSNFWRKKNKKKCSRRTCIVRATLHRIHSDRTKSSSRSKETKSIHDIFIYYIYL